MDRLKTKTWIALRKKILERDHYTCRQCCSPGDSVHHIVPHHIVNDDNEINLITLCRKCHRSRENKFTRYGVRTIDRKNIEENFKRNQNKL